MAPNVSSEYPASILKGFVKDLDLAGTVKFEKSNWLLTLLDWGVDISNNRILDEIDNRMFLVNKDKIVLYDWVRLAIPQLAQTRKIAILSSNSLRSLDYALNGLKSYFSVIKTWQNLISLKPSPEGIIAICYELGIAPSETLMIGDSQEDEEAARAAGVMFKLMKGEDIERCFKNKKL